MGSWFESKVAHHNTGSCKSGGIGRRPGFRIQFPKGSGGSSPFSCTIKKEIVVTRMNASSQSNRIQDHILLSQHINVEIEQPNPFTCLLTLKLPSSIIDTWFHHAALHQKKNAITPGFNRGEAPVDYIKNHFKEYLIDHIQELLFRYSIVNYLYAALREQQIVCTGEPQLVGVYIEPHTDAVFQFEVHTISDFTLEDWKYLPFKSPKRKNYKDIDRQVESFIKEEKKQVSAYKIPRIAEEDWVNFDIAFVNEDATPILKEITHNFWLKVGNQETDGPLRELFIGKESGEQFITNNRGLQEYFSSHIDTQYSFLVTINDIIPYAYFCFELYKKHFRLKTNKDIHNKIIEVFSYRNDISQRRAIVEEALKLLISKNRLSVPNYLVLRQQKVLLDEIKETPDYHVYRAQKDFQYRIRQLAEKQIKEEILIDRLTFEEHITVNHQDVKAYLNLCNRPRMKEFIYFLIPSYKIQEQEVPIPTEVLKHYCLREKTTNYIIHHLTR